MGEILRAVFSCNYKLAGSSINTKISMSKSCVKKIQKIFHSPIDKVGELCYTYTNLRDRCFMKKGEHGYEKAY